MGFQNYYRDKSILITGAASGLGKELALILSHQAKNLILLDINEEALRETKKECEESDCQVFLFTVNLLDEKAHLFSEEDFPLPDYIFANAGVGGVNPGFNFSMDIDAKIVGINYSGLVKTIAPFLQAFKERGSGHIVGISSLASMRGLPGASSYSASKAAVNNFLESLRMDLRPYQIYVTTVLPGFIQTPMANHDEFDMPFTQNATTSAIKVLKAVARKKRVYAFPKLMYWGTLLNRLMPAFLYDSIMPRVSGQSKDLKARIF